MMSGDIFGKISVAVVHPNIEDAFCIFEDSNVVFDGETVIFEKGKCESPGKFPDQENVVRFDLSARFKKHRSLEKEGSQSKGDPQNGKREPENFEEERDSHGYVMFPQTDRLCPECREGGKMPKSFCVGL